MRAFRRVFRLCGIVWIVCLNHSYCSNRIDSTFSREGLAPVARDPAENYGDPVRFEDGALVPGATAVEVGGALVEDAVRLLGLLSYDRFRVTNTVMDIKPIMDNAPAPRFSHDVATPNFPINLFSLRTPFRNFLCA